MNLILGASRLCSIPFWSSTPQAFHFKNVRLARDLAEWLVGPLLGLYVLQIAMVAVLARPLREVLRAATVATLLDIARSGTLDVVELIVQTTDFFGVGGTATVLLEASACRGSKTREYHFEVYLGP